MGLTKKKEEEGKKKSSLVVEWVCRRKKEAEKKQINKTKTNRSQWNFGQERKKENESGSDTVS